MSQLEQQVIDLRRQLDLLKRTQVVILDKQPKSPSSQSIWRNGASLKIWDGKNWIDTTGSGVILDFTTSVLFSSTGYNNVTWSAGVMNIGTDTGVASHSIGAGSFTMTTNTFLYWDPSAPTSIQTTTTPATAITSGGIIVAVGQINSDPSATSASIKTFGNNQNDLITADQIVANAITANKLATTLLYAGSIVLNTNGIIRGGQTAFNTGTGFFLGYSSGTYKFSIGNPLTNYMSYDGTDMILNGGTIRTGISGQRIEISGNNLKAYDSSNILRVQTANSGIRITESTGIYYSDISASVYDNGSGIIWPSIQISDTSGSNRVGIRTAFIYGTTTSTSLDLYLRGGTLSFKGINNAVGSGVMLTSPDDDTLTSSGAKFNLGGIVLEKIGSDLYWNGTKIN